MSEQLHIWDIIVRHMRFAHTMDENEKNVNRQYVSAD
jgi:hypothetical protein